MTSDFVVIPELFYNAQQDIISAETIMKQKRNSINACKSSIPESYEYKSEIFDICENLSRIIISVSRLERNVSEAKDRLVSLDSAFAAEYYQCASNKYNDMVGPLSQEQLSYSQYTSDKYNRSLFKHLSELKSKGLLTPELESVYNQLEISLDLQSLEDELSKLDVNSDEYQNKYKDYNNKLQDLMNIQIKELESKESLSEEEQEQLKSLKYNLSLNELESELEELIKNPVVNPGIASSRMSESDAKKYQEQAKKYGEYQKKKNELESKIKDIRKSLGTYKNKWYEDVGEAIVKTGSAWKTAWQTKSVNDALSATKQTLATGAVVYTSAKSGVAKIEELIVDGYVLIRGAEAAGLTWLFNHDAGDKLMDKTLDFVKRDLVGEVNKNFYENNSIGKWINENSNLKYDSAGAKAIQNAGEFVGKGALATAATVVSGGAAAPIVIGTLYGAGNAGEKYTQSVDRDNGESYNYGKALLRTTAGAVAGAAEFYGYGQMGAGMLGVNISPQASTSFVKNFLVKDTILDSVSVVADHGVNVAFGDETWQQALLYGGAEFALALGMNAIGARQATKAARAAEAAEDAARAVKQLEVDFDNPLEYNKYLDSLTPEQKTKFMTDYYNNGSMFSTSEYTDYFKKNFVPEVPVEKYYKYSEAYLNPKYFDVKSKKFLWPNAEGANQFIHLTDEEFLKLANEEGIEGLKKFGAVEVTFEELKKEGLTRATWKSNISDDVYGEYFGSPSTKGMNDVDHRVLGPDTSYTITNGDGNIYKMTIDEPLISTTLYDVDGFNELKIGPGTEYEVRIMKTHTADWFGQKGGADQYAFYVTDKNGKILTKNTANVPQAYKLSRGKLEEMGIIRSIG